MSPDRRIAARRELVIVFGALFLVYVPLLAWQAPAWLRGASTGFLYVSLPRMVSTLLVTQTLGVAAVLPEWLVALPVTLVAAAFLLHRPQSWTRGPLLLGGWLALPVLSLWVVTLRIPVFNARYLVFVVPALLMLAALGTEAIWRRSRPASALLLAGTLAVNACGIWLQARAPLKTDFRGATGFVVQRLDADDVIVFQIPYGRYSYEYYSQRVPLRPQGPTLVGGHHVYLPLMPGGRPPLHWLDGLYTNAGTRPEEVARQLEAAFSGEQVVWLFASEAALWDERLLVKGWLDENGLLTAEAHFTGVDVYRYQLASR